QTSRGPPPPHHLLAPRLETPPPPPPQAPPGQLVSRDYPPSPAAHATQPPLQPTLLEPPRFPRCPSPRSPRRGSQPPARRSLWPQPANPLLRCHQLRHLHRLANPGPPAPTRP